MGKWNHNLNLLEGTGYVLNVPSGRDLAWEKLPNIASKYTPLPMKTQVPILMSGMG
jgi:hypothetical protein